MNVLYNIVFKRKSSSNLYDAVFQRKNESLQISSTVATHQNWFEHFCVKSKSIELHFGIIGPELLRKNSVLL
jgi:hypothetical protein